MHDLPKWYRLNNWISALADVASGLISVLTFTYIRPSWDMDHRFYVAKKRLKERKARNKLKPLK